MVLLLLLLCTLNTAGAAPLPEINFISDNRGETIVREDNVFVPESTLKVSISTPIVFNLYRLVAMDYVMVVTDPYENIVFVKIIKDRSRSYTTESEAVFSKKIPKTWLDGKYTIDIYSYDRVDYNKLKKIDFDIYDKDEAIEDLSDFYDNPDDDLLEDLEVLKTRSSANIVKDRLYFYIDSYSSPVKIQNLYVDSPVVPVNSTVLVSADVENTGMLKTGISYQLYLNDKPIKTFSLELGPGEWTTLKYEITDPPMGNNRIQLGKRTANFAVSAQPLGPANFIFQDIFTDTAKLYAGKTFNISLSVLNTGRAGSIPVVIVVNGREMSQVVDLAYGEKKTIRYQVMLDRPGAYSARIVGTDISKVLYVSESKAEQNEPEEDENYVAGFLLNPGYLGPLILIIIGVLAYRRHAEITGLFRRILGQHKGL